MTKNSLKLEWIPGRFAVVQLPSNAPIPMWVLDVDGFTNITRTKNELSIVCQEHYVPGDMDADGSWLALCLSEPVSLKEIGLVAKLTGTLAEAGVSLFAISTYENDILLIKSSDSIATRQALGQICDISSL
jgi:uncharacterized protein